MQHHRHRGRHRQRPRPGPDAIRGNREHAACPRRRSIPRPARTAPAQPSAAARRAATARRAARRGPGSRASRRTSPASPAIATAPISPSQITAHRRGPRSVSRFRSSDRSAGLASPRASIGSPDMSSGTSSPRRSSTVGATSVELTMPSVRVESGVERRCLPRSPAAPVATSRLVMWLGSWITSTRSPARRAARTLAQLADARAARVQAWRRTGRVVRHRRRASLRDRLRSRRARRARRARRGRPRRRLPVA